MLSSLIHSDNNGISEIIVLFEDKLLPLVTSLIPLVIAKSL